MYRYEKFDTLVSEMAAAFEDVAARFQLDPYDSLAVCAGLEAISSPLKLHRLQGVPLMRQVGRFGSMAYYASLPARELELIKRPGSLSVNPAMDAILAILINETGALSKNEIVRSIGEHSTVWALDSAFDYLKEAGIISRSEDGTSFSLTPSFRSAMEFVTEEID